MHTRQAPSTLPTGWARAQRDIDRNFGAAEALKTARVDELPPVDRFENRQFGENCHQHAWVIKTSGSTSALAQASRALSGETGPVVAQALLTGMRAANTMASDVLSYANHVPALGKTLFRRKLKPLKPDEEKAVSTRIEASLKALTEMDEGDPTSTEGFFKGFVVLADAVMMNKRNSGLLNARKEWLSLWKSNESEPPLRQVIGFIEREPHRRRPLLDLYRGVEKAIENDSLNQDQQRFLDLLEKQVLWTDSTDLFENPSPQRLIERVLDKRVELGDSDYSSSDWVPSVLDYLLDNSDPSSYAFAMAFDAKDQDLTRQLKSLNLIRTDLKTMSGAGNGAPRQVAYSSSQFSKESTVL